MLSYLGEEYFVRQGKEKKHCLYTVKKRDEIYINHLKYYTNHLKFIFVTKLLLNCAKNTVFFCKIIQNDHNSLFIKPFKPKITFKMTRDIYKSN